MYIDNFIQLAIIMENLGQTQKLAEKIVHVSTMEDGPHRNSSEQVRLELRATLNATLSIQEPATKMHPVYESGWYRIQEQFQEIQVSIQVMIDRWPGNLGVRTRRHFQLSGSSRQVTSKTPAGQCSQGIQGVRSKGHPWLAR